jgi:hypothetical protein
VVRVNNSARPLTRAFVHTDGNWRASAIFVSPLSLSISPPVISAGTVVPGTAITGNVTATPSGGLPPFTYSWSQISGAAAGIANPVSATTSFSQFLTEFGTSPATFRCTVTDALGSTALADIGVSFAGFTLT